MKLPSALSRTLLCIAGPTASGKTAVACQVARRLPVETLSCDSMQVYRGMGILTQAPTRAERRALNLHLAEFVDPSREYSAARFAGSARRVIAAAQREHRLPMIVGGTGLYFRALLDGLFEQKDDDGRDEAIRRRLGLEEQEHGPGYLHRRLSDVDPPAAARIHPNDVRRLIRALEVYEKTGRPISQLQTTRSGLRSDHRVVYVMLDRQREDLYRRIGERVDRMLEEGLVRQVERLRKRRLGRTAAVALGLREISAHLAGECPLSEAVERLKMNTRRYAKRQLSWFRHEKGVSIVAVPPLESPARTAARIVALLRQQVRG